MNKFGLFIMDLGKKISEKINYCDRATYVLISQIVNARENKIKNTVSAIAEIFYIKFHQVYFRLIGTMQQPRWRANR